jgi:type IV secretory pathway TraG/TraD family ATPase VirD4
MVKRQVDPTSRHDDAILLSLALGLLLVVGGGAYASLHIAARIDGTPPPPSNPWRLLDALTNTHTVQWTPTATQVAVLLALAVVLAGLGVIWLMLRAADRRVDVDRSARHMATSRDLAPWTGKAQATKARRLGADTSQPGLPIGRAITPSGGRQPIYTSWEDVAVIVAGPRTHKTTAYAVPMLLAAPGAAIATSNKRDLLDTTRAVRGEGGRVWVFDPQHVAAEPQGFWWDPISFVSATHPLTGQQRPNEVRAGRLAAQIAASVRPDGAKQDAYFDTEAVSLLGVLFLAAACGERSILDVYGWLTVHTEDSPILALRDTGFTTQAATLTALAGLPDKQREGVYGTARALLSFVTAGDVASWCTRSPGVPRFDPEDFAAGTDTLYLLSREGHGSAGPLVAALTVAVLEALEQRAVAAGGRLPVPAVGILDEAANICRIRDLDGLYSHYGSRGITLVTILQSWAQGAQVWGPGGMEKLWSAANISIYGGGVDDDRYLKRLSDLIGPYEQVQWSESVSKGRRTRSRSVRHGTILTPAELRELRGRAVAFLSGTRAVLLEPQPWYSGPDRHRITAAAGTQPESVA